MPKAGLEPARGCPRQILSLLRLPIPPLRRRKDINTLAADCQSKFSSFNGVDANLALIATLALERDLAGNFRKERIVLAAPDVEAGVEVRAALANEDAARRDDRARLLLDAQTLRLTVAAVARGADTFFMCESLQIKLESHLSFTSEDFFSDLDDFRELSLDFLHAE